MINLRVKGKGTISKSTVHGIFVPMVTPFKGVDATEINFQAIAKLTNYLVEGGVHGLMPLGTSGEFGMLDREERRRVVEAVVKSTRGRLPVVAGVCSSGTDNSIKFAKDAERARADAVISTGPYYYKTTSEGLLRHFQSILESTDLPLMIYNIPGWVGYNIPADVVFLLAKKNPGRVLGVKFTSSDMSEFQKYLTLLKDETSVMIGSDSLIFSALELGAAGAIVGSANVLPKETSEVYESFVHGDVNRSRKVQEMIYPFSVSMNLGTFPSALKEAMRMIGIDCGSARRPLLPLSASERSEVKKSLAWKMKRS